LTLFILQLVVHVEIAALTGGLWHVDVSDSDLEGEDGKISNVSRSIVAET